MNKWILIPLVLIAIPFVVAYMWIRHPILCWREAKESFDMCFRGIHNDKD